MAKTPKTETAAPTAAFAFSFGDAPPEVARGGGKGAAPNPIATSMLAMPVPNAKGQIAQFFVAADVPDSITDEAEREKAAKDEARKISNRISGVNRRFAKQNKTDTNGAGYNFALRTVQHDGKWGVRVYRLAPKEATATAAA